MPVSTQLLADLKNSLARHGISLHRKGAVLTFKANSKEVTAFVTASLSEFPENPGTDILIPLDHLVREPEKIAALLCSRLGLNKTVFARKTVYRPVPKDMAKEFLDSHHLMGYAGGASHRGLFTGDELVAVASFSKGRKMRRLAAEKRSFELIRFCTLPGITVSGGLSRLVRNFCTEKNAGDVMTYVDRQLSDGTSFLRAGFRNAGSTEPHYFLVNKASMARVSAESENIAYDKSRFYLTRNLGSHKLIFSPEPQ
jgi:hypothetical protein